jgi:hypothetical protein
MQKQQTPNQPGRDPNDIERLPEHDDKSRDPRTPPPDRHPDPLKQPGDEPDVKPDVIAQGDQQRRQQHDDRARGTGTPQQDGNQPRPGQGGAQKQDPARRQKPGSGSDPVQNRKQ